MKGVARIANCGAEAPRGLKPTLHALVMLAIVAPLAAQIKLPPFTRHTQPNGLTVLLAPRKDTPLVSFRALVRGGAEADPAELAGLTVVTAELLRRGTTTRTADQFAEQVDFLGATFTTAADESASLVSTEFLRKDTATALDLFADAILHPAFPEDEFKKALSQRIDAAKAAKDNPGRLNSLFFPVFYFGPNHPYGRPSDEISLAPIQRSNVIEQHRSLFVARNTTLIAVGDFDPPQLRALIGKTFASMPTGQPFAWTKGVADPKHSAARLLVVDKPDATQTYFIIAMPGIHRTHPDRVALWLINTLFGDRFTSMLNDELRVNSGLTYGAGSRVQTDRLTGAITINTFPQTQTTTQAIDLALDVLKRLTAKGIDTEQLSSSKAYVKGIYPTENLETSDQLAGVLSDLELYGLNRGEIDDLISRIDSVTLEQANTVARKYYRMENLQFCLTGQASKIKDSVSKYAKDMKVVSSSAPGIRIE